MSDARAELVSITGLDSKGGSPLDAHEVIKLPMPSFLAGAGTTMCIYTYNSSCPAQLKATDCKASEGLMCAILSALEKNFSIRYVPEHRIFVVGGSNMGILARPLISRGILVVDLTNPGWLASGEGWSEN